MAIKSFKRFEKKFIITKEQYVINVNYSKIFVSLIYKDSIIIM